MFQFEAASLALLLATKVCIIMPPRDFPNKSPPPSSFFGAQLAGNDIPLRPKTKSPRAPRLVCFARRKLEPSRSTSISGSNIEREREREKECSGATHIKAQARSREGEQKGLWSYSGEVASWRARNGWGGVYSTFFRTEFFSRSDGCIREARAID